MGATSVLSTCPAQRQHVNDWVSLASSGPATQPRSGINGLTVTPYPGIPLGGVMPGYGETLSRGEAHATIAYFQSFWSDDIYARWDEINSR